MPTKYSYITKPETGAGAFQRVSEAHAQSQAAILLALGRQIRGDDEAMMARASAANLRMTKAAALGVSSKEFPIPTIRSISARARVIAVAARARKRYGVSTAAPAGGKWQSAIGKCASDVYKKPTLSTCAQLMELCLQHPQRLVRIAAAFAYHPITGDPKRALDEIAKGVASKDDLERELAATALARIQPDHDALRKLTKLRKLGGKSKPAHTATMVHGTWAANGTWWRPGGDFFGFVQTFRNDLYTGGDIYRWTGAYSDAARAEAAQTLKTWVEGKNFSGLDLFAHSHGANAVMLATQQGMRAGKLILLSCPVRVSQYFPNFANTTRVISIRVKLDLVILADGGGQKFRDARIEENVLPIWFNHSASHDPQVWRDNNLSARI